MDTEAPRTKVLGCPVSFRTVLGVSAVTVPFWGICIGRAWGLMRELAVWLRGRVSRRA